MPGAPLRRKLKHIYVKVVRPNALRTWPWSFLSVTKYCFTLCKEWLSPNSYLCIYNKNCRQANGDNRHIVPDVPTGLDRDIWDMPIASACTHPDANKHARHIPMYRPVHSAHANKCSLRHRQQDSIFTYGHQSDKFYSHRFCQQGAWNNRTASVIPIHITCIHITT